MSASRSTTGALYAGLALTVAATLVPYLDRVTSNTLTAHIRAGYPTYSQARGDAAADIYLTYLSVIGALGVASWVWMIRAVKTGWPWARAAATTIFVLAALVAVTDLFIKDTSGDTGLPHLFGWVGLLPCLPGLLAVTLLWRRPTRGSRS